MTTATPLEMTWTLVALVGVLLSAWMILDATLDYRAVRVAIRDGYARAQGARWWIAVGALVGNGLTLLVWVGFFIVGLIAMQYPPPPRTTPQEATNTIAGWVLIGMEVLLASAQIWTRFVRLRVTGNPHVPISRSRS